MPIEPGLVAGFITTGGIGIVGVGLSVDFPQLINDIPQARSKTKSDFFIVVY